MEAFERTVKNLRCLHSSPYILFQISGTYHGNVVFAPAPGFINLFLIYCCQAASFVLVLFLNFLLRILDHLPCQSCFFLEWPAVCIQAVVPGPSLWPLPPQWGLGPHRVQKSRLAPQKPGYQTPRGWLMEHNLTPRIHGFDGTAYNWRMKKYRSGGFFPFSVFRTFC